MVAKRLVGTVTDVADDDILDFQTRVNEVFQISGFPKHLSIIVTKRPEEQGTKRARAEADAAPANAEEDVEGANEFADPEPEAIVPEDEEPATKKPKVSSGDSSEKHKKGKGKGGKGAKGSTKGTKGSTKGTKGATGKGKSSKGSKGKGKSQHAESFGEVEPDSDGMQRFRGVVAKWNKKREYWFVDCPELHKVYGCDVVATTDELPEGLGEGSEITFVAFEAENMPNPIAQRILTA